MGITSTRLAPLLWMFAAIDQKLYERLLRIAYVLPVRPDQPVIRQGELDDSLYVVASGDFRVVHEEADRPIVARLSPGDVFGEMAVVEPGPRTATVESVGYGQVLRFAAPDLADLLRDYPAFRAYLRRTSTRRRLTNLGIPAAA
jgi:CRP-like cAMP-binding protein